MATVHVMKQGDTLPVIRGVLTGLPAGVTLVGATVRFHLRNRGGELLLDRPATIEDVDALVVAYAWQAGETDSPGAFRFEFEVTFADGTVLTFPNDRHGRVRITPAIA
jgi:hypothetical protein